MLLLCMGFLSSPLLCCCIIIIIIIIIIMMQAPALARSCRAVPSISSLYDGGS